MEKRNATVLIVDDDPGVLQTARFILKQMFSHVVVTREPREIPFLLGEHDVSLALLDMNFKPGETSGEEGLKWLVEIRERSPETGVVMITAYGELNVAVEAMKHGATDFIVKPWENEKFMATIDSAYRLIHTRKEVETLRSVSKQPTTDLIGSSTAIEAIKNNVRKVAPTDASVLILGENGTGKEVLARTIHELSPRADKPFIKVDVGSIAGTLFESELFGHEKGAFTDAHKARAGRIELANGGTLFLDEIGNIAPEFQAKLLSVLQNGEVIRVGSTRVTPIDIRLICATNVDIRKEVEEGRFREDLFYRVNTFELTMPPLRHRQSDIDELARHFLNNLERRYHRPGLKLSKDARQKLMNWAWPGNVRELEHTLERAVILSDNTQLEGHHLQLSERPVMIDDEVNIKQLEKGAIIKAIEKHGGNLSQVAKELGLGRTTLYRKIKKYGL